MTELKGCCNNVFPLIQKYEYKSNVGNSQRCVFDENKRDTIVTDDLDFQILMIVYGKLLFITDL